MYKIYALLTCLLLTCFSFTSLEAKSKKSRKDKKHKEQPANLANLPDFENYLSPCILETKKITIPEYPESFNPTVVKWKDGWLMGCRVIKDKTKRGWHSYVGLIKLDQNFNPIGRMQLLNTRSMAPTQGANSADPRLLWVGEDLYVVYSDTLNMEGTGFNVRMWVGKLIECNGEFIMESPERIARFPDNQFVSIEKNWIPFSFEDQLLLAYHILPHRILRPLLDRSERCEHICSSKLISQWKWGELRGGTPGIQLKALDGDYLAIFHSCLQAVSMHSEGKISLHYFMGAYRFSKEPPFEITQMSAVPLVGKGFYHGNQYDYYWRPVQAIFPAGIVEDGDHLWVSYGRQDHELWIAKIDTKKLIESLQTVISVEN